mgnify:CR=1 FL=1
MAEMAKENAGLQKQLDSFRGQYEAALRHWETEARAKLLEERLACARLAESEGHYHQQRVQNDAALRDLRLLAENEREQRRQERSY